MSKKDLAKTNFLNSPEGRMLKETMAKHDIPVNQVSDTMLPDDYEFEGWKVVKGVYCRTVGEYKRELAKIGNG